MRCEERLTNGVTEPHRWVARLKRIKRKACGVKEDQDEHIHEELSQFGGVHSRDDLSDVMSCSLDPSGSQPQPSRVT
jgi:hypothetical protein